jgi:glycosidase
MYPNDPVKLDHARHILQRKARDNARTPVQWTAGLHAGFTSSTCKPWMRVNDDYTTVNAEAQVANPNPTQGTFSVHAFWKRALELRNKHKDVFVYGDYEVLDPEHEKVVAWKRWSEKDGWVFVGNSSGEEVVWDGLEVAGVQVEKWVTGNYDERDLDGKERSGIITLRPWEGSLGKVL